MLELFDRLKIFIMIRVVWKILPYKKNETIRLFEATEDDSAWQLLYGMKLIDDNKKKAELFCQAVEESHHAELFKNLYKEETGESFQKYISKKFPLYRGKENAWKLFVYCLIGEASAAERFDKISKQLPEGAFKSTLEGIVADEIGHIHKAKLLLKADGKNNKEIGKEIKSVSRARFKEAWMRSGRQITSVIIDGLLYLIYFSLGGFFSLFAKNKSQKKVKTNYVDAPKESIA